MRPKWARRLGAPALLTVVVVAAFIGTHLVQSGQGSAPTQDQANAAYLQGVRATDELSREIQAAVRGASGNDAEISREFRGFAEHMEYMTLFFSAQKGQWPFEAKRLAFRDDLGHYDAALRAIASAARRHKPAAVAAAAQRLEGSAAAAGESGNAFAQALEAELG